MKLRTALGLGRVSNLPTVWTNTLAGAVLAGAAGFGAEFAVMLVAFSLFYTGGMFLNDAFDAQFDAAQRPERPIPSGEVSRREVFGYGYGMMAGGIALLAWIGRGARARRPRAGGGDHVLRLEPQGQCVQPGGDGNLPRAGVRGRGPGLSRSRRQTRCGSAPR